MFDEVFVQFPLQVFFFFSDVYVSWMSRSQTLCDCLKDSMLLCQVRELRALIWLQNMERFIDTSIMLYTFFYVCCFSLRMCDFYSGQLPRKSIHCSFCLFHFLHAFVLNDFQFQKDFG